MGLSKSLAMYGDVKAVLDKVCENGSAVIKFPTPAKASSFRQRCYYYRKLLHNQQAELRGLYASNTSTPYDHLTLSIDKEHTNWVNIGPMLFEGEVEFEDGSTYVPTAVEQGAGTFTPDHTLSEEDQDLVDQAAALAETLKGNIV